MGAHEYRFTSRWVVSASPERCWAMLEHSLASGRIPWWPAVAVDATTADLAAGDVVLLRVRSPLGYRLHVVLTVTHVEPPREIAASASGDLAGRGRLRLRDDPAGAALEWTWDVTLRRRWMRAADPVLRPVFALAHRLVMRRGERGFVASLAEV